MRVPVSGLQPELELAIEAHKAGRFAEAEAGYGRLLRSDPRDPDALNFLGMLRCQTGRAAEGLSFLRRSVEADPANAHAWLNLGIALVALSQDEEARSALTKATELAPSLALAWYNLGVCLGRCRQPLDGAAALHRALQLEPGYLPAYESLARVLHGLANYAEAAEVYREWLQYDPENPIARHMLAATTGAGVPAKASAAYVQHLFDDFAQRFDGNLQSLQYRAPQWLAERLGREVSAGAGLDILDAGCGTGLCGPLLRPLARRFVGVDLSPAMIAKARERGSYDELAVQELSEFMRARAQAFDVVVSADTLIYFGALEEPLAAARTCLRPGGIVAFTLERLDPAESDRAYRLETHGRYSHAEAYVRAALAEAGCVQICLESQVLRRERGRDVIGHVVLARAP